jgi:hypothetical protein
MRKRISAITSLLLLAFLWLLQACQPASASNFEVLSLDVTPNKVLVNDKFTVTAAINNTSNEEDTYIVPVMVNGIADDRTAVTIEPGKSKEIKFTLSRSKAGTYEIRIGDKNSTVSVEEAAPASFELTALNINMEVANPGEEVVITAHIANMGGSNGDYISDLKINGVAEQSERLVMAPGSNYNTVFKVTKTEPGTYTVGIGNLSGKFTVQKPIETIQITAPATTSPTATKRFTQRPQSCGSGGCGSGGCQ